MAMTPEEKKEYHRQWFQKNKARILRRKKARTTEETKEQAKEYQRAYYQQHKAQILARQKKTNAGRKHSIAEYGAKWFQKSKPKVAARRRATYPAMKAKEKEALAQSDMIGPTEAASMLGITLRSFRQWVTDGKIPSTKSPTGRRLISRSFIEQMKRSTTSNGGGAKAVKVVKVSGANIVPEGFDLITQYRDLTEYSLAFAAKQIGFLLLVGSPGSGKSKQIKADLEGRRCQWIDNHVTNLGLYCSVYEANNRPIVLDDVNHFLKNKQACSLLKAITQTDETKSISWESTVKALEDREVPRKYTTTSPVCLIGNLWDASNADFAAIQDRALPVAFYPTAETIHNRVIELGWCKDKQIIDFIGENLCSIPQPSMREYYQAIIYKRAGMNWRKKLLTIWGQESSEFAAERA